MRSLGEIKESVLNLLQKFPSAQGTFSDAKIYTLINEALDFVAVDLFAAGEGWLREIIYLDWPDGARVIEIPEQVAVIHAIRWLHQGVYYPLRFDPADSTPQYAKQSGLSSQLPQTYRIVQNKIYINQTPASGGSKQIELEYARYPDRLKSEADAVMKDFDNAMIYFVKYYVANTLLASIGKPALYADQQAFWYSKAQQIAYLRNNTKHFIGDFGS